MKNISTKKINVIFLGLFLISLVGCASNAPPPPEDDPLYQALNSESPGAIPGRPPAPEGYLSQDKDPTLAAAASPQTMPSAGLTPNIPSPTQMPDYLASAQNAPAPTSPMAMPPAAAMSYPNPYGNAAPMAMPATSMPPQNIAPIPPRPSYMPPMAIPRIPPQQVEEEFDFSNASCNIDEEGIKEILAEVKKHRSDIIKTLPDCLKLNRSLMMRAAIIDPSEFQYAADILKEDESFVHRMLEINPEILRFASASLRSDKDFMEQATYLNRNALQYADLKLLDNKIFMRNMIKIDAENYIFASDRLKEIHEYAETAFADNGMLLKYAPQKIKADKKLVTIAVKSNSEALQFASDNLQNDRDLKKLAARKTSIKEEELKKFLSENYLNYSDKKNVGIVIDNRLKFFADNKIVDRNYVTKWQRSYDLRDENLRLISADSRNFPVSWKDDFKRFPLLIQKIEKFMLNHQVDQNTIDSLSTVYFWKVKKDPQTVVFNLYLLRDSKDIELGPKFGNVTSLTAIAQKRGEKWDLTVVEVIFDSEMKIDLAYENGHKKFNLWDLYKVDKKDQNPKIIFKVEDKFKEYFEVFEEQNNGKYHMVQRVDSIKDALQEDERPAPAATGDDAF